MVASPIWELIGLAQPIPSDRQPVPAAGLIRLIPPYSNDWLLTVGENAALLRPGESLLINSDDNQQQKKSITIMVCGLSGICVNHSEACVCVA